MQERLSALEAAHEEVAAQHAAAVAQLQGAEAAASQAEADRARLQLSLDACTQELSEAGSLADALPQQLQEAREGEAALRQELVEAQVGGDCCGWGVKPAVLPGSAPHL